MKATSLAELYAGEKDRIIQNCTFCGICVDVCPAIPFTHLSSMHSTDVQAKVMDVLKDGIKSEEAVIKAASCMECWACQDVCPEDINPFILQKLLHLGLVKLGHKSFPQMEMKAGDRIYFYPHILASMQIKPEDICWLNQIPDSPQHKDIVVFTGCSFVMMPDKILLVRDMLEKMGLNFAIVSGGELCCGFRYSSVDLEKAEARGKHLLHALSAFKPQQVLYCCAGCTYQVSQFLQKITSIPFKFDNLYNFLSQHSDKLKLTNPIEKTATIFDSCVSYRALGDTMSMRKLLQAIPGLKLIEMKRNSDEALCCGGSKDNRYVGQTLVRQCLENAKSTCADILVDYCPGCHMRFCSEQSKYKFDVQHYLTIIGESMGIVHEDKIKKFYLYADASRILGESKENVEASPYELNLVAHLSKRFFEKPTP